MTFQFCFYSTKHQIFQMIHSNSASSDSAMFMLLTCTVIYYNPALSYYVLENSGNALLHALN